MHHLLFIIVLSCFMTCIIRARELDARDHREVGGNCIGCHKPAPPVCCDAACPKCMRPNRLADVTKPKLPEFFGLQPGCEASASFPLDITITDTTRTIPNFPSNCPTARRQVGRRRRQRLHQHGSSDSDDDTRLFEDDHDEWKKQFPFLNLHAQHQHEDIIPIPPSLVVGNDNEQIYLKERAMERALRYPIPDGSCSGGQCPCNNCVCCFTETIQCRQTTTCTLTSTATRILTEYDEVVTISPTLISVTSTIIFTVLNETVEQVDSYVNTSVETFTETETFVSVLVTTNTIKIYLSTFTITGPPTTIKTAVGYFLTFSSTTTKTINTLGMTEFYVATATTSFPYYTGVSFAPSVTLIKTATSVNTGWTLFQSATPVTYTTRILTFTPEVISGTANSVYYGRTESFTTSLTINVYEVLRTRTLRTSTIPVGYTSTHPSPTISITCSDTITVTTTPVVQKSLPD